MDTEFATRCIHLPEEKQLKDRYGAMTFPIYQTATFAHPGPGRSTGYDYSRSMNPSRDYVERVVASLEEGCGAIAASSGMAAVSLVMELFSPGDTILIDSDLYGGSLRLFRHIKSVVTHSIGKCRELVSQFTLDNASHLEGKLILEHLVNQESLADTPASIQCHKFRLSTLNGSFQPLYLRFSSDDCLHR